jgi:hypothetical protein
MAGFARRRLWLGGCGPRSGRVDGAATRARRSGPVYPPGFNPTATTCWATRSLRMAATRSVGMDGAHDAAAGVHRVAVDPHAVSGQVARPAQALGISGRCSGARRPPRAWFSLMRRRRGGWRRSGPPTPTCPQGAARAVTRCPGSGDPTPRARRLSPFPSARRVRGHVEASLGLRFDTAGTEPVQPPRTVEAGSPGRVAILRCP